MNHSVKADAEFLQSNVNDATVSGLHANNLLNLQCSELLEECLVPPESAWLKVVAAEYTRAVSDILHAMPPIARQRSQCDSSLNSSNNNKLRVLPVSPHSTTCLLNSAANAHVLPTITLTVLLPTTLFEAHDYRKGRYFEKRNAAVWQVANYLSLQKQSAQIGGVYWRYWKADARKVCLVLVPLVENDKNSATKQKKSKKQKAPVDTTKQVPRMKKARFRLQLNFQMESMDWIPLLRLVPNRCNLGGDGGGDAISSVHYNHCVAEDAIHTLESAIDNHGVDDHSSAAPNYKAAVTMIQIWCLQRGLLRGHDTLDEDTVNVLLLYLYRTKQVNARMAPMQVVTAWLKLLADTVWLNAIDGSKSCRTVLVLPAATGMTVAQTIAASQIAQLYATTTRESPLSSEDPPTLLELYQRDTVTPVLLDPSMRHNYLYRLSPSAMRTLQRQATLSLQCLHSVTARPFQQLFMSEARFWTRHDAYMRIPLSDIDTAAAKLWGRDRADLGDYESKARGLVDVLRRALGDRVLDVSILTTGNGDPSKKHNSPVEDSDEIPTHIVDPKVPKKKLQSPTGSNYAVLGITVNPDTCYRVVDRGPPHEQTVALQEFMDLWGQKAELRRFKDGAIVHAVVWDSSQHDDDSYTQFQNDDTWQGGIVERIIRHILKLHFLKSDAAAPQFALRDIVSTVDGVADKTAATLFTNPLAAHRKVMKAFEALTDLLRKQSALTIPVPGSSTEMKSVLGIPLAIDAAEPLSPALRYAALYPPVPHPLLGASPVTGQQKTAGAVGSDPIEIQIRFGASSKWPTDLKAIGAAKTAMLLQLVKGIESLKKSGSDGEYFEGPMIVTPSYADICFMGYVFRVFVRADPELKLLRSLHKPSLEAALLLQTLTRKTVVAATHHTMVHAVYTSHPSSSATVRLAKRWLSTHLLSDQIPFEALELMVAHVYTDRSSPMEAPGTATAGFLRLLHLLATHDWTRQPLIVDPQGHLNGDDHSAIHSQFEKARGEAYRHGPALYIISPCDHAHNDDAPGGPGKNERLWSPTFTASYPERVVLSRAAALAERTHAFLRRSLVGFDGNAWTGAFQESTESFRSYSALLRVDPAFVVNTDASSSAQHRSLLVSKNKSDELESTYTRSMRSLAEGPKYLRRKLYRNLMGDEDDVLLEWRPIHETVQSLRAKLGGFALFFYNDLCPDVLAVVWRPLFQPRAFSAVTSEYVRPVSEDWQSDTMVTLSVGDILRGMACLTSDIVIDVKVFDNGPIIEPSTRGKRKHAEVVDDEGSDDDSES